MRVLLVEDDTAVRDSFSKALTGAGFDVEAVGDCCAALAVLSGPEPSVVICDFCLPGTDGSSFFQQLEGTHPHIAEKVVFVTGWIDDENTRNLLAYTGRPVLRKPVEVRDLVNAVQGVAG